jgi:hypothetical protein
LAIALGACSDDPHQNAMKGYQQALQNHPDDDALAHPDVERALKALRDTPDEPRKAKAQAMQLVAKAEATRKAARRLADIKKEEVDRRAIRDENARAVQDPALAKSKDPKIEADADEVNLARELQSLQALTLTGDAPLQVELQEKRANLGHRIISLSIKADKAVGPGQLTFNAPDHLRLVKGETTHALPPMKPGWEKLTWTWEVQVQKSAPTLIEVAIEVQGKSGLLKRKATGSLLGF